MPQPQVLVAVGEGTYELLSNRNYQPGTYSFDAIELTATPSNCLLRIDRSNWADFETTNVATVELIVEYSPNGLDPWRVIGGLKCQCGPAIQPDGNPAIFVSSDFNLPNPGTTGRQIRGSMILSNRTKRMTVLVVVT
jgi:hypothetical protein